MRAIAIIPARGGSKRIPKKNIKLFHGKPLIAYSIETAIKSKLFDKVIVSTDSQQIAKIAKKYGADIPFMRPKELSDDFTITSDVVNHAVNFLANNGQEYDFVCTIYATAPLLHEKYLAKGYEKLKNSDAKTCFSVTSMPFPIQRTFKIKNGRCEMFYPEHFHSRSQDLEEAYQDAGQFYWENRKIKSNVIGFGRDNIPLVLPRHLVCDIDTFEDWERAERLYEIAHRDRFDECNRAKKSLDKSIEQIHCFRQRDIFFISVEQNLGYEIFGKKDKFSRPVLVYKKLSKDTFLGIPLTTKTKLGTYYFTFNFKDNKKSTALLNQMRTYDIKRANYYSGKIGMRDFKILEQKVLEFMKITPNQ